MKKVLTRGRSCSLYGAVIEGGVCEAEDFLAALGPRQQAQFQARIERLTEIGFLRSPEEMRQLRVDGDPPIHEIKVHAGPGYRLYVVRYGTDWVATHGREKPKGKKVPAEVKRAREIVKAASK